MLRPEKARWRREIRQCSIRPVLVLASKLRFALSIGTIAIVDLRLMGFGPGPGVVHLQRPEQSDPAIAFGNDIAAAIDVGAPVEAVAVPADECTCRSG